MRARNPRQTTSVASAPAYPHINARSRAPRLARRVRRLLLALLGLLLAVRLALAVVALLVESPGFAPDGIMLPTQPGGLRCERVLLSLLSPSIDAARSACALHSGCAFVSWSSASLRASLCAQPPSPPSKRRASTLLPSFSHHAIKAGCDAVPPSVASQLSVPCGRVATGRFVEAAGRGECERNHELMTLPTQSLHDAAVACITFAYARCSAFVWQPLTHTATLCSHLKSLQPASDASSSTLIESGRSDTGYVLTDAPWLPVQSSRPHWAAGRTSGGSVVHPGVRPNCGELMLTGNLRVSTVEEAIVLCASHPLCTTVSVWPSRQVGVMCQGLHGYEAESTAISAEIIGCESYRHSEALADASIGRAPACRWSSLKTNCGLGAAPAMYRENGQPVCDHCPSHGCPQVAEDSSALISPAAFNMRLQSLVTRPNSCIGSRAFNPSIFAHNGMLYAAIRLGNGTQCFGQSYDGEWELDFGQTRPLCSSVAICRLASESLVPETQSCTLLDLGEPGFGQYKEMMREFNIGAEDPRGFSFNGSAWVVASVSVPIVASGWRGTSQRPLLVELDNSLQQKSIHVLEADWHSPPTKPEKNWMPLVDGSNLFMVHEIDPPLLCRIDFSKNLCQQSFPLHHRLNEHSQQSSTIRGGTPFVRDGERSWVALAHELSSMPFGKRYSHRLVRIAPTRDGFDLTLKSAAFRLPDAPDEHVASPQDVQFAAGLVTQPDGYALVSYGVSDCHSWLARISLPQKDSDIQLQAEQPPSKPRRSGDVLLEAPITASGAVGADARGFAGNLLSIEQSLGLEVTVVDTTPPRAVVKGSRPLNGEEMNRIEMKQASSNFELCCPYLTIRHWWPLRLQPAVSGTLALLWSNEMQISMPQPLSLPHVSEVWLQPSQRLSRGSDRNDVVPSEIHMPYLGARVACSSSRRRYANTNMVPERARGISFLAIAIGDSPWASGIDTAMTAFSRALGFESNAAMIIVARRNVATLRKELESLRGNENIVLLDDVSVDTAEDMLSASDVLVSVPRLGISSRSVDARAKACSVPVISPESGQVRTRKRQCELDSCDAKVKEHFNSPTVFDAVWREPVQTDISHALVMTYKGKTELPSQTSSSERSAEAAQGVAVDAIRQAISRLLTHKRKEAR